MPNDVVGQVLKMMGMEDPRYAKPSLARALYSNSQDAGGVDPAINEVLREEGIQNYDYLNEQGDPTMFSGEQAPRQSAEFPALFESQLFQDAVDVFIEQNGTEPATDSDFEGPGGVLDIMMQLREEGADVGTEDTILQQMGEE